MTSPLESARHYVHGGLNVIPLRTDGSKRPAIRWKEFTETKLPWRQGGPFFASGSGIGIVCGPTSGDLEVIDFDAIDCFVPWATAVCAVAPNLLQRLPIVATPDDGRHIYYRCDVIEGNHVLAKDEAANILIETRGQGGFVVAPGSPLSTHPSGRPYRLLRGDLSAVPRIDPLARQQMLEIGRTFNRYIKPCPVRPVRREHSDLIRELFGDLPGGVRPGDVFNKTADWSEILEPHGWTVEVVRGETTYWRKPDSFGNEHHATTNHNGSDRLYVFSTAILGFEAGQSYTKFFAYTILNFDGCCTSAAKHLAQNSFTQPDGGPCKTN